MSDSLQPTSFSLQPLNWRDLRNATLDEVIAWADPQPWCRAMADCAQDAEWHAEGDVWTHTKLVLQELSRLDDWPSLSPHQQTVLIFTALFHDVAKPLTSQRNPDTGRIRSPYHAVQGEKLARSVLRDLNCDLSTREEIAKLVRYHGRPAFLLQRDQPAHEVVRLSWLVNNRLLYLFALADSRGRQTTSTSRPEENLHFWKIVADENNCFDQPYPFATEHARFTFLRQAEPNLHYVPHEDFSCRVTLLSGLPGSGKDTWLHKHHPDLPMVSLDEIRHELKVDPTDDQGRVVQTARERCRVLLRSRNSFAFNATNTTHQIRSRWLELFTDYNARLELVYLEPPIAQLLKQNNNRDNSVPEDVLLQLATRCEPPTWIEGHSLIMSEGDGG